MLRWTMTMVYRGAVAIDKLGDCTEGGRPITKLCDHVTRYISHFAHESSWDCTPQILPLMRFLLLKRRNEMIASVGCRAEWGFARSGLIKSAPILCDRPVHPTYPNIPVGSSSSIPPLPMPFSYLASNGLCRCLHVYRNHRSNKR